MRTVAEAQTQDPSKIQASAQVGSPIRNLTQNPIESSIPASTPRVLNEVPSQNPNPDFTGLHAMLSSAPVPPPHVAAQLIRAMMTPPGQGGVVAASQPYVPPPSNPGSNDGSPQPAQTPRSSFPSTPSASPARPASTAGGVVNSVAGPSFNNNVPGPSANFRPAAQQHISAPLRQNVLGNTPFIGGTIGEGLASLGGLGGLISKLGGLFSNGLRSAGPAAEEAGSLLDELPAFL